MERKKQLEIKDLTVSFPQKGKLQKVIEHLSFEILEGEILGIVGESGSGKSMTALSVMGLLPGDAVVEGGRILYSGEDILTMKEGKRRALKGTEMAMIFQEPVTSLNPVMKIGVQVGEMLWLHSTKKREEIKEEVISILARVGLKKPEELYGKYPYQLSGGMCQRVMIAMAMIARPRLLIADEPTTALDVTIQMQILELIKNLNEEYKISVILISHDLGVIKKLCSRALVLAEGKLMEENSVHNLFYHPKEAYTQKLLNAVPRREKRKQEVIKSTEILLKVEELDVFYRERKGGLFQKNIRKQVVKDISFTLRKGEILGIVGESGCGKSTLAKAITGLIKDTSGRILSYTKGTQMVFQNPYASLNPARKVEWILREPLKMKGGFSGEEQRERIREILSDVGLKEAHLGRYVSQLSGGQRQRVSIACALILKPQIIILDEPVSALDVTVQDQILKLLLSLREKYKLSYLFISHDLNVIYQMCDRVGVMYQGRIVEMAEIRELYAAPGHDYTKKLLTSIPEY